MNTVPALGSRVRIVRASDKTMNKSYIGHCGKVLATRLADYIDDDLVIPRIFVELDDGRADLFWKEEIELDDDEDAAYNEDRRAAQKTISLLEAAAALDEAKARTMLNDEAARALCSSPLARSTLPPELDEDWDEPDFDDDGPEAWEDDYIPEPGEEEGLRPDIYLSGWDESTGRPDEPNCGGSWGYSEASGQRN